MAERVERIPRRIAEDGPDGHPRAPYERGVAKTQTVDAAASTEPAFWLFLDRGETSLSNRCQEPVNWLRMSRKRHERPFP